MGQNTESSPHPRIALFHGAPLSILVLEKKNPQATERRSPAGVPRLIIDAAANGSGGVFLLCIPSGFSLGTPGFQDIGVCRFHFLLCGWKEFFLGECGQHRRKAAMWMLAPKLAPARATFVHVPGVDASYGQMVIARTCPPMPLIQFIINCSCEVDSNIVQTLQIIYRHNNAGWCSARHPLPDERLRRKEQRQNGAVDHPQRAVMSNQLAVVGQVSLP